jgi:hypothetical protein
VQRRATARRLGAMRHSKGDGGEGESSPPHPSPLHRRVSAMWRGKPLHVIQSTAAPWDTPVSTRPQRPRATSLRIAGWTCGDVTHNKAAAKVAAAKEARMEA